MVGWIEPRDGGVVEWMHGWMDGWWMHGWMGWQMHLCFVQVHVFYYLFMCIFPTVYKLFVLSKPTLKVIILVLSSQPA